MSTLGTTRGYSKTAVSSFASGLKILTDHASNGVRTIDWTALLTQLQAELGNNMTVESVADQAAREALTVLAGEVGKRLVRQADTGVFYIADSAGTGAGPWTPWVTIPNATDSVPGVVELATAAEARARSSETLALTPSAGNDLVTDLRNALAPRGGVRLDGTANKGFQSTLTGQNITTDPFAVHLVVQPNSSAPSGTNDVFLELGGTSGGGATANSLLVRGETGGEIKILLWGASSSDFNRWSFSGFYTTYGGKVTHIDIVRNASGNPTIYFNGVDVTASGSFDSAGTPPTWQGSITSTYLVVGQTQSLTASVFGVTLYNLALSASDVAEIYELDGAVPYRFQFGSQAGLVTGDNSTFASDTGFWSLGDAVTISGGKANFPGGSGNQYIRWPGTIKQKRYRVRFTISGYTAGALGVYSEPSGYYQQYNSDGVKTLEFTALPSDLYFLGTDSTCQLALDDVTLVQLGAVVHLAFDEGIGFQLHDASTNKLDAVMTTTGVSHLIAKRSGYVRTPGSGLSWSGTHEAKSILGVSQRAFPDGVVLDVATLKSSAGSSGSGATLGTTNSATRWSAAAAFTTSKKVLTLANQLPAGTTDADTDCLIDPDTANITATIQAEVHYKLTEGS